MKLQSILLLGILALPAGCGDDLPKGKGGGAQQSMTFQFNIDGMLSGSTMRVAVPPVDGETTVETLHLLFFQASEHGNGEFAAALSLTGGTTSGKLAMETTYVLPGATSLDAGAAYHVIGIANIGDYVGDIDTWLARWEGETEAVFRDRALLGLSGTVNETDYTSHRPIRIAALPMHGSANKPAGQSALQMTLTRNVARIDVTNTATATHTLQTVSLWNAILSSSVTGDARFDYSLPSLHSRRFYGVNLPAGGNELKGGLYAFANYSATPAVNDKTTTCLVIGMENAGGKRYYRVNIHPASTAQLLKNNCAYHLTILSVTGDGYPTEDEAWEGTTNQLACSVNGWALDDNGLIVSDENSILSLPVKTVKIGSQGGDFSYPVFTFSTLENPAPLRIKNEFYDPETGSFSASVRNGQLIIKALPMNTGEEKRSGIIIVAYAGLETSVNVLQTVAGDVYLEVTLDEEWSQYLPPTANTMSEFVYVKASGPYAMQLYGSTHFAFQNSLGDYVTRISSEEFPNNKFHIYASSPNDSKTVMEEGFVMITLDADPVNYVAVVTIYQLPRGSIGTEPADLESIRFSGNGKLEIQSPLAPDEYAYTFRVVSEGPVPASNVWLAGTDYDKFRHTYYEATKTVTVSAKSTNISQNPYTATLMVRDSKNGTLMVTLVQTPEQ